MSKGFYHDHHVHLKQYPVPKQINPDSINNKPLQQYQEEDR